MFYTARRIVSRSWRVLFPVLLRPDRSIGVVRLGSDYGGWWVPTSCLRPGALIYSGGAGEDITLERALLERGCTVRTFDPTPRAIAHVEQSDLLLNPNFSFHEVGWWGREDTLRFYVPRDPAHVSHSAVNLQQTDRYIEVPVTTVARLHDDFGDGEVALIKMDIEGAEYEVIQRLADEGPLPSALCIEFDCPQPMRRVWRGVSTLRSLGYIPAHVEQWAVTFVRDSAG